MSKIGNALDRTKYTNLLLSFVAAEFSMDLYTLYFSAIFPAFMV